MPKKPSRKEQSLDQWLWDAADILRGPVDKADFKAYIFPLLFLKRLSDVYDEEYEKLRLRSRTSTKSLHNFQSNTVSRSHLGLTGVTFVRHTPTWVRRSNAP